MKSLDQMILKIRTALATNSLVNWGTLKQEIGAHKDREALQSYLALHKKSPLLDAGDRHVIRAFSAQRHTTATTPQINVLGVEFAMRWIPAGRFLMGSPTYDMRANSNEKPQHEVTLTRGFWMMETPVTQGQYFAVMGENPSRFTEAGLDAPVDNVNWYEAAKFANELSALEGTPKSFVENGKKGIGNGCSDYLESKGWRLPTEAEWEYACRAGTTTPCYGDLDKIAWYMDNSDGTTHVVGQKHSNDWGLYDMLGNVSEWCYDYFGLFNIAVSSITNPIIYSSNEQLGVLSSLYRIIRGGGYNGSSKDVRSAYRGRELPQNLGLGFRLVRGL